MGYRTYIGYISKKEYKKIKSMTKEQLVEHYNLKEDGGYIHLNVFDFGKKIYELGEKMSDFKPPKKSLQTFFKNRDLNWHFIEEHDFNIVTKEFLKYIIEYYRTKVKDYYNNIINPFIDKKTSDFLNSIKFDFNSSEKNITFDFNKITQKEQNSLYKIIEHIRSMRSEWVLSTPYDLDEDNNEIVSSWKYEYTIFELVRIYKTFDWNKNMMIYYGY